MAEAAVALEPGTLLVGKYRIERVLGKGGMGVVVLATHVELDDRFAIKILIGELDADAQQRFLREARAAAGIKSDHVARVVDVGTLPSEQGAVPYMVMEYLEGTDLAGLIEQRGALPVPEAIELVLQACVGLTEAHARGFVHRDLKPANLFVQRTSDGRRILKLLDFGISKATQDVSLTSTRAVLGTPAYMAPEQWRSAKDADARADIWSLGVVLHELLSGQRPFQGESVTEMCAAVLAEDPPPLKLELPVLEKVVARCLEKEPADRYQRVPELARDLSAFAADVDDANALVDRMDRVAGRTSSPSIGTDATLSPTVGRRATGPLVVDAPKPAVAVAPPNRTRLHALIGAAVVILAVAGYALTRSSSEPTQLPPAARSTTPERGGILRVGMNRADETRIALYAGQPTRTQIALRMVLERLIVLDASGKPQPSVLAAVEPSRDYKTLTLTLRDHVMFHGTACAPEAAATAVDLEYSIKEAIAQRQLDFDIASMTAKGRELTIALSSPVVTYAHALSHVWLVPAKLETCERDRKDLRHPIGTGPFRWVVSPVASTLALARAEHYWREQLPYLDRVELVSVTEATVALAGLREEPRSPRALHAFIPVEELRAKLVDTRGITPTLKPEVTGLELGTRTNQGDVGLWLLEPIKDGPLRTHVELRRAISLAIDRAAAADKGSRGASSPVRAYSRFLQPGALGYEDGAVPPVSRDVRAAKQLVAQVVARTGTPIPPLRIGYSHNEKAAQVVVAAINEIGLAATLVSIEMSEQSNVLDGDKVDAMLISRWTRMLGNELIAISAYDQQRSPAIAKLLRELAGKLPRAERAAAYQAIEAKLLDELPSIPIAALDPKRLTFAMIVQPSVRGLVESGFVPHDDELTFAETWLSPGVPEGSRVGSAH